MKHALGRIRPYLGGANFAAIPFFGIALLLTALTSWRVFANCSDDSDYLGLTPFFFAFGAAAVAGVVFTVTGVVSLVRKRWKQVAGAFVGGLLCVVLGIIVPYLTYELSNCPPASPGGPMFSQSRPIQKCLGKHGSYEVDFVTPDMAKDDELVRGLVIARPPRSVMEEFRPRFVASVLLFSDEDAARSYSKSISDGASEPQPEKVGDAWILVRYGADALGPSERESGEPAFRWQEPTSKERAAVGKCISLIPTWFLPSRNATSKGIVPVRWEAFKDSEGYGYLYFDESVGVSTEPLLMEDDPDSLGAVTSLNLDFHNASGRLHGIEFEAAPDMYPREIERRWGEAEELDASAVVSRVGDGVRVELSDTDAASQVQIKAGESKAWLRIGLDDQDRVVSLTFVGDIGARKMPASVEDALPEESGTSSSAAIVTYLEKGGGIVTAGSGGQMFCAVEVLGESRAKDPRTLYGWYMCSEWSHKGEGLTLGTGVSIPASFTTDAKGKVVDSDEPGDGTLYAPGIRRIFPDDLEGRVLEHDIDVCALEFETVDRAREHYSLPDAPVVEGDACFDEVAEGGS